MADGPLAVRFGGLGGQGLVTLGAVLAEAGARAGLKVAASQAYGSRARGGATRSDVILSREPIDFPHVLEPNLLVVLAQEAYDLYSPSLAPGGVILADDFFVRELSRTGVRQGRIPATTVALEQVSSKVAANFVMLGALVGYTGVVGRQEIEASVQNLVSGRFQAINQKAFDLGMELGKQVAGTEVGTWQ